jgi:hypothetical protein
MGNDGELSARPSKSGIGTWLEALILRARQHKTAQRLTRKLQQLGYVVELRPAAADQ